MKAKCGLACEELTEKDYIDLLWTTLSEFPGRALGEWKFKPQASTFCECCPWRFFIFELVRLGFIFALVSSFSLKS